jgi:hypothetical protein
MNRTGVCLIVLAGLSLCLGCEPAEMSPHAAIAPPKPRASYGALLEHPTKVLHGAGQTYRPKTPQLMAFDKYVEFFGPELFPVVFMEYCSVGSAPGKLAALRDRLEGYEKTYDRYVIPQIGLYTPHGDKPVNPKAVARLIEAFKAFGRPMFIRIGYEFNGTWYKPMYQPEHYKAWFRAIARGIREAKLPVATVWCAYPGWDDEHGSWEFIKDYYPGDAYVDWWGMDMFSPADLATASGRYRNNPHTRRFLEEAAKHHKPVLLGEATPRYVGATDEADWYEWFVPFFEMINTWPQIKGHTYINWDWTDTRWPDWDDARLESGHPIVQEGYRRQISSELYLHASPGRLPEGMDLTGQMDKSLPPADADGK